MKAEIGISLPGSPQEVPEASRAQVSCWGTANQQQRRWMYGGPETFAESDPDVETCTEVEIHGSLAWRQLLQPQTEAQMDMSHVHDTLRLPGTCEETKMETHLSITCSPSIWRHCGQR